MRRRCPKPLSDSPVFSHYPAHRRLQCSNWKRALVYQSKYCFAFFTCHENPRLCEARNRQSLFVSQGTNVFRLNCEEDFSKELRSIAELVGFEKLAVLP